MTAQFEVDEPLSTQGIFWDPTNPKDRFSAQLLRQSGRRIELTSAAKAASIEDLGNLIGAERRPTPVTLQGITKFGPCTLLGLTSVGGDSYLEMRQAEPDRPPGFITDRYIVSAAIAGVYLPNGTSAVVNSITLRYTGMTEWLQASREITPSKDRTSFTYPAKGATSIVEITCNAGATRVRVDSYFDLKSVPGVDRIHAEVDFTIEPSNPQGFEWFLKAATRLEGFLSACIGSSVTLRSMAVAGADGATGWLIQSHTMKAAKPYPPARLRCSVSDLATALQNWMGDAALEPFETLVYGTLRGSAMAVETEFLSLAQAIESFHRLTDTSTVISGEQFERVRKAVSESIDKCATGPIADRLKESIGFANGPSFRNRIEGLLNRLPAALVEKLLGNPIEFEQALRQTRNHFTHQGAKPGTKVLTEPGELFVMNQKLHALLRWLLLTHLGFSAELVFEPVLQQARRFTML
jgi:hypothetical protein